MDSLASVNNSSIDRASNSGVIHELKEEEPPVTSLTNNTSNLNSSHSYSTRSKGKVDVSENKSLAKQKKYNVIVQPRLKPVPYKLQDLLLDDSKTLNKSIAYQANDVEFFQYDDHPFNKRGFKYRPCRPNPLFVSNLYSTTELPPYSVRPCYFDRSPGVLLDASSNLVTSTQGWRSIRSNVGIREGKYFMEFNIVNANNEIDKSHVRIGVARREASLEAPVGFDGYGYGLRDLTGQKITLSRPKEFMADGGFKTGDTIGIVLELPSLEEHKKAIEEFYASKVTVAQDFKAENDEDSTTKKKRKIKKPQITTELENEKFNLNDNISRDQIPIKYKGALYYEQYEYTSTKKMDHLLNPVTVFGEKAVMENSINKEYNNIPSIPNSKIRVFKNGIEIGIMFEDLFSFLPSNVESDELHISYNTKQQQNPKYRNTDDGSLGYYPMISVFQGGIVSLNAGPDFKFPVVEPELKPLIDRYDESVLEEWYWDIIDEIETEYLDSFDA